MLADAIAVRRKIVYQSVLIADLPALSHLPETRSPAQAEGTAANFWRSTMLLVLRWAMVSGALYKRLEMISVGIAPGLPSSPE